MKRLLLSLSILCALSARADNLSDSNALFDFAEGKFARYFSPPEQDTFELQGYLVRYYPQTKTYLGTQGDKVYVYGKVFGPAIKYVGLISDYISVDSAPSDITDAIFSRRSNNCATYVGDYTSAVTDISRSLNFSGSLEITVADGKCVFSSNNIPNHDFGQGGSFATPVSARNQVYAMTASPMFASTSTALSLEYDNAVMLNGVKLDLLAAACYGVGDGKIGCNNINQPWRLDPMSPHNQFGTDNHNAHTQPNGAYHYHGDPNAFYLPNTAVESPVVGFAADGFPIFGSYFNDAGGVRKAESSYRLKSGSRPSGAGNPGGSIDGTYRDDYEYVEGLGDLDECNGMVRDGVYAYYLTDAYPYVMACFRGTPDTSFRK